MNKLLASSAIILALGAFAGNADAGRIVLTGHDNDYHYNYGSDAGVQELGATKAELNYVRDGSSLPVLVIDDGTEAVNLINAATGGNYVAVTVGAVTAADFNPAVYSAFVVASVSTCGGCDNPVGTGTTLAGFSSAIDAFYTAGGGILGLTSADDPNGFAYVPEVATSLPIFTSSGFVATANGTTDIPGFLAVNGDETHNIFSAGTSSAYLVAETGPGGEDVTIFTDAPLTCVGSSCTFNVPEPMSAGLLGAGLAALGIVRRRKRTEPDLV